MSYPIQEQLIQYNRPGTRLSAQGFVIHSTATPGATAQNEHDYFNSGNRGASAHYFADWNGIIRCVLENEIAWHAGPTANRRFLSVEMCEPKGTDYAKFSEVWNRTVWLVADVCKRYGWTTKGNVFSHRGISALYGETDHTDPIGFLARHGKTWDDLLAAIDKEIGGTKVFENLVCYDWYDDGAAKLLADKLKAPVVHVDNVTDELWACAKKKYKVGGGAFRDAQVISGADRFATMQAVLNL